MSNRYEHVRNWRENHKRRLVACFGNHCAICKLADDPNIYDFHHLDPGTKAFTVSQRIRSWGQIAVEAAKCVMLCANCHRKVHCGIATIPNDAPQFDEGLATEVIKDRSRYDECPECGKYKLIGSKTCSKRCSLKRMASDPDNSGRFKSKRPPLGQLKWLAAEVRKRGYRRVSTDLAIADGSLRTWLEDAGIAPRFRRIRSDRKRPVKGGITQRQSRSLLSF